MAVASYAQSPNEIKSKALNFNDPDSPWLAVGEQLTGTPVVTISPNTTPPLTVAGVTLTTNNSRISYTLSGGLAGTKYKVVFLVNTSTGQKEEVQVNVSIRATH